MSELSDAINEMRNMRESYDQIGAAAEAYNTGKAELATNITAKGVQASATETLPELAEKVAAISQDTYEINGGEMYAKQLFGVANNDIVPGYWNLYDVLAQLLSDGRLVNYGGILLAEYYKGYDSLALSGAGAGGAYVVSDKDANGNFIMYTEDTTHTWATEDDGKGNRFVAYCFADEYHDFQITDTNTSPRSIFIGRKVGIINCLVNTRISQIVVPDGNELKDFLCGDFNHNFGRIVVLQGIQQHTSGNLIRPNFNISEQFYISVKDIAENAAILKQSNTIKGSYIIELGDDIKNCYLLANIGAGADDNIPYLAIKGGKKLSNVAVTTIGYYTPTTANGVLVLADTEEIIGTSGSIATAIGNSASIQLRCFKKAYFLSLESSSSSDYGTIQPSNNCHYIYFGYKTNDKTKSILLRDFSSSATNLTDIELKDGYCKSIEIGRLSAALTEANMYAHILQRLKQDEPDCGEGVTITLGATNLAKLTSQESIDLLDILTNTYGYTFA